MPITKVSDETVEAVSKLPLLTIGCKVYFMNNLDITECVVTNISDISVTAKNDNHEYNFTIAKHGVYWFADKLILENAIQRLLEEIKKELL